MKNLLVNIFKTLFYFDLAVIAISLIPDLKTQNPAKLLLWREGMAFAVVWFLTVVFLLFVEKRKLRLYAKKGKFKSALLGVVVGIGLPSVILGVMWLFKSFKITGFNKVEDIYYYIAAVFFNAAAGELLIRGYLFKIYKKHHGFIFATIFSTALFLSLNFQIFSLGKMYIANIVLLNICLCCITDKARGPFGIAARFAYSLLSGLVLGGKIFTEQYPVWGKFAFSGKKLISGGSYQIEGSVITVVLLSFLIFIMLNAKYNLLQYLKKENLKRYALNIKEFAVVFGGELKKRFSIR